MPLLGTIIGTNCFTSMHLNLPMDQNFVVALFAIDHLLVPVHTPMIHKYSIVAGSFVGVQVVVDLVAAAVARILEVCVVAEVEVDLGPELAGNCKGSGGSSVVLGEAR